MNKIKVGILTRGFEDFQGKNLLLCIGVLGRLTNTSTTKFKFYTDDVVNLMGNQGIQLLKPTKISSEELANMEWNLDLFVKKDETIVPKEHYMYTNNQGETSVRFNQYTTQKIPQIDS